MTNAARKSLNRFLSSTAITAISLIALSPAALAQDAGFSKNVGDYDVWEFDGITATEKGQGYVRYDGDRIVGNLTQEDIGRLGHVDLRANLTVATGVEAGPMHILGKLTSTGQVMILDTDGFLFGSDSVVDTAGLAVLGGHITDHNALKTGKFDVQISDNAKIDIQNGASITVAEAGLAAFVAPSVSNAGIINAKMGKVVIGSAERATIDLYGDNLFEVALSGDAQKAIINNTGEIRAEAGQILITANAAKDAVDNVINMGGVTSASSVSMKGGKIVLGGGSGTKVNVTGKIEANGTNGGSIDIQADEIETQKTAEIYADSTAGGNGGNIFLWGNHRTYAAGRFSATGNNGFVETSGNTIDLDKDVVVTAATWMIDPIDIIITAGIAAALEANLDNVANANSTIIVDTSAAPYGGAGADAGNISIDNDITWTGGASLQFNADNNIDLDAVITSGFAGGDGSQGAVTFNAANAINIGDTNAAANITTAHGDIVMNGGGVFAATANSLTTSAGEITIYQNDGGSIQNAIDAINNLGSNFNTIEVGAGTYAGTIDVNEANTRLWGAKRFIDARTRSGVNESVITANSPAVILSADGSTINGFEITGGSPGILVTGNNTRMRNNIIHGQTGGGGDFDAIRLENVNASDIFQNLIFDVRESAVKIDRSSNVVVRNNKIENVNIGVNALSAHNSTVFSNEINDTREAVVVRAATGFVDISENEINDTGFNGVIIDGFDSATVNNNEITRTGDDGIDILNGNTIEIAANTINEVGFVNNGSNADFATKADGIFVNNVTTGATLTNNTITKTYDDGIQLANSAVNLSGNILDQIGNDGGTNLNGADSNGADGIFTFNVTGSIDASTISNAQQDGIDIRKSNGLVVSNNILNDIKRVGVVIGRSSNDVNVKNNAITNAIIGVQNFNSDGTRITGNTITDTFIGVNIIGDNSENIVIGALDVPGEPTNRNTISDAHIGVNVIEATNVAIVNNDIQDTNEAIVVRGQKGQLDVNENYIRNTNYNAILVDGFDRGLFDNNDIALTGDDGIDLRDGHFAEITNNIIREIGFVNNGLFADPEFKADGIQLQNVGSAAVFASVTSKSPAESISAPRTEYGSIIFNNDIAKTYDDGIEVVNSGPTLIEANTLSEIGNDNGSYLGGADYNGADAIHVRNVNGTFNYLGPRVEPDVPEARPVFNTITEIPVYSPSTDLEDYSVVVTDNVISRTSDDGVEVVGNDFFAIAGSESIDVPTFTILGTGRTLVAYNTMTNIGVGVGEGPYSYGPDFDGLGADAVHIRGVANDGGRLLVGANAQAITSAEGLTPSENIDGFGYQVEVLENTIQTTGDDGIEVLMSGKTLIAHNNITDTGLAQGYATLSSARGYYGDNDGDGIFVGGVYANPYMTPRAVFAATDTEAEPMQNSVEIVDNTITNTGDDGIEVIASGNTLVDRNIVTNAGTNGGGDIFGADGIAIANGFNAFFSTGPLSSEAASSVYLYSDTIIPTRANVLNNVVENSMDDGIEVVGNTTTLIDNNTVTLSGDDGITALGFAAYGEPTFRAYPKKDLFEAAPIKEAYFEWPEFDLEATNNVVDLSGTDGIQAEGFDTAYIATNEISNSTENGIFVSGFNNGSVAVEDNTLTNNDIGAQFESGIIDLTGETNTFIGGRVGLRFAPYEFVGSPVPTAESTLTFSSASTPLDQPGMDNNEYTMVYPYPFMADTGDFADLSLIDDDGVGSDPFGTFLPTNFGGTIGAQLFNGQSDYYVELANGAFFAPGTPTLLNATDSTYITGLGAITPSDTGGILTQAEFDELFPKFFDFTKDGSLGLFFFGVVNPIDENDLLRSTDAANFAGGPLDVTVLSMPNIPGGPASLNNIATFAGGNNQGENGNQGGQQSFTPEQLNNIETAAGEGSQSVTCWGDAANAAGAGQISSVSFGGGLDDLLNNEAGCASSVQ